jgi:hypothetical protein
MCVSAALRTVSPLNSWTSMGYMQGDVNLADGGFTPRRVKILVSCKIILDLHSFRLCQFMCDSAYPCRTCEGMLRAWRRLMNQLRLFGPYGIFQIQGKACIIIGHPIPSGTCPVPKQGARVQLLAPMRGCCRFNKVTFLLQSYHFSLSIKSKIRTVPAPNQGCDG